MFRPIDTVSMLVKSAFGRSLKSVDELRNCLFGFVSSDRRLHWPNSQRRKTRRPAGRAVDQVRVRDQSEHGEGARPRSAADTARPSRRGDRMMKRRELLASKKAPWNRHFLH